MLKRSVVKAVLYGTIKSVGVTGATHREGAAGAELHETATSAIKVTEMTKANLLSEFFESFFLANLFSKSSGFQI